MPMGNLDPEYMRLYREYAKALKAYSIALQRRRRMRAGFSRQKKPQEPRRPVGAPHDYQIPQNRPPARDRSNVTKPHRVYLGSILGWVTLRAQSTSADDSRNPVADFDMSRFEDTVSQKLWLNAKDYYTKCKKAFFDYALRGVRGPRRPPRRDPRPNLRRARESTHHAANLGMLGLGESGEKAITNAAREVETACYKVWDNYVNSPKPKSRTVVLEMIGQLAEAQFYPLEDSRIVKKMTAEVSGLINSGQLK
jgi:hypothetical protein